MMQMPDSDRIGTSGRSWGADSMPSRDEPLLEFECKDC